MTEKRVQFNNIVQNQLPLYVREEFPLISEFLKQYYIAQEYQSGPIDLLQNIDRYIKVQETTNNVDSVVLGSNISYFDTTIQVDFVSSPRGTQGFPDSYGLLKIGNEIITYTSKTSSQFIGCIRGFSGVTSYKADSNPEELVFNSSSSEEHKKGDKIENLSVLFLKEFLLKTKRQLLPGLEDRQLSSNLNQNLFIKQAKDFYLSKGTDRSFEILFRALYNEDVKIIKTRDYLLTPSNANYRITNDLVVEPIIGDPTKLDQATLYQDSYGDVNQKAYGPVTKVEQIITGIGETFYKLSIDAGYNRDITYNGAVYGAFSVQPKTRVIGQVSAGSSVLDVDSTVGFAQSGELSVSYSNQTKGVISYSSKSLTQFFGCSNINGTILDASDVGITTFAYGRSFTNQNEIIEVRINSVLQDLKYSQDNYYYSSGDTAKIKSLGTSDSGFKFTNWFYNVASTYKVKNVELFDTLNKVYKINFHKDTYFRIGDSVKIIGSDNQIKNGTIVDIASASSIFVSGQEDLSTIDRYVVSRDILKTNSTYFPSSSIYSSNVQNLYKDKNKLLISSPSIPTYINQPLGATNRSLTFSGNFVGDEFKITLSKDHGFYTGDSVYYTPEIVSESFIDGFGNLSTRSVINSSIFEEGLYFIKRLDSNTVKFARSKNDILNSKFISIDNEVRVNNNKLEVYDLRSKNLESQKLLREISEPENDGDLYETLPGYTGILINGVEIKNYKSSEVIYHGRIDSVDVIAPGEDYDVIDPPILNISDAIGVGATGYASVSGSLIGIRVLDPGFDYANTPTVNITGGNGKGAVASANMKLILHSSSFNSDSASARVGLGTSGSSSSTIGFGTYHKFRNAERIIYQTNSQKSVGGLSTDASYYVSVVDPYTVKLHRTQADAIVGLNTVVLTSYGEGKHELRSYNAKSVVESINVISSGSGYENKLRTTTSSGISTSNNIINIENHDYKSGEIVKYFCEGTPIGGLTNNSEYYLTKIDDDRFTLSNIGLTTDSRNFFYSTKQYVNLTSVGVGTHKFNYPDITVKLVGNIGISSVGTETFEAKVQPIFRGSITSVHLKNKGIGYGSSTIISFDRQPNITLSNGKNCQLYPIITDGQITEVLVLNSGREYNSPPDLNIFGDGTGAVLTPVLENNLITSIKVVEGGSGYNQNSTTVLVSFPGRGAEFKSNIQKWRVNLFQKHFLSFTNDDGFISNGLNEESGLQYSHLYSPRKLRESIFSVDQTGKILYGKRDLKRINGTESNSSDHSPIIGWAYDGNPIYGPYGYVTKEGGIVSQMKSGYQIDLKPQRPPISEFPEGFFVEDYTYKKVSDDTVLDENNGRFCVTPEYPKGTYAYFASLETSSVDSSGPFVNYKRPVFPYLIGNNYHSKPNEFNFKKYSNQTNHDLANTNWSRNTHPYNIIEDDITYKYFYVPDKLSQEVDIKAVSYGVVERIGINTGGDLYQVNDSIVFNNEGTKGFGASARVSKVLSKSVDSISVASTSFFNTEIYSFDKDEYILYTNYPHNLKNDDLIVVSGISTTSSKLEGSYRSGITTNIFSIAGLGTISSGVATVGVTGIVTYFNVKGNLAYPRIRENDIFEIGNERVKVLNVEPRSSRIRVIREIDGTVGTSHSATSILYEDPRKIIIKSGLGTTYDYKLNKEIYFNPKESVGVGTDFGVGIGTTISFSNPGAGLTEIFVPTKSIYIQNHNLETGDILTYSANGGSGIQYLINPSSGISTLFDQQTLYVVKISDDLIGVATVRVGLGTTGTFVGIASTYRSSSTLFFAGIGTNVYHSFKTNYSPLTCKITRNLVTVSTAGTHGLVSGDIVDIDVNPSITTSFSVKYDDYNRRTLINSKSFSSAGVSTNSNTFTIQDHGFETGQKVIHTATLPAQGLSNNGIYYIVKIDNNTFKLAETYYDSRLSKPSVIGISSASDGALSLINPPISVYKDSTIVFNLSDSSLSYTNQSTQYPAFELNFYTDENFTQVWNRNADSPSRDFGVRRTGRVGVSADAKVTLTVNDYTPTSLYYRLDPIFESSIPAEKQQSIVDYEVESNSRVIINDSIYNGEHKVSIASTTEFTYTLGNAPEKTSYSSSSSILRYSTNSKTAYGSIYDIEINDRGKNYYSIPGISTISSKFGKGALLDAYSESIGKIRKVKISDIGYNFPSDKTLRPDVTLPQIVKLESLGSIDFIGITSVGRGYASSPDLVVFDGKTNEIVPDLDLRYTLGDSRVTILKNTFGISKVKPSIIPIRNSNGIGINTISYNPTTKDVTVRLSVGFSTADSFPIKVNDRVLIENVSIGIGSTAKGYNSENYGYKLFTITQVDENRGGIGTVTYNLSSVLKPNESPGVFDPINSVGRIIPEKYFPIFDVNIKSNDFIQGEVVEFGSSRGIVESWDPKVDILKISTSEKVATNQRIKGLSSNTQGIASSITTFDANFEIGPSSKVENGWETNSGVLNDNLQRIQDSFYYQNFAYSLKSKVPYGTWEDVVSALNHTAGFKKFSDYQLESTNDDESSMVVGLSTNLTSFETINDLIGYADLNCVYDFDLASENNLNSNSRIVSNEIRLSSRILTDYFESVGNRVLLIDDISGQFNSNPRSSRYSVVSTFNISDVRALKYITYVRDKRFSAQRQLMLVDLIHDGSNGYLNQYGRVESVYDQGSFDFQIVGSEGQLLFYPRNYSINDYHITSVSYHLGDSVLGVGSTNIGGILNIFTTKTDVTSGVSTTFVSISNNYSSLKVVLQIRPDESRNEFEMTEINLVSDGSNIAFQEYGQLTTTLSPHVLSSGFGTYYPYIDGSNLKIDYNPGVGVGTTGVINAIVVAVSDSSSSGIGTLDLKHCRIESRTTSIASSTSPIENVIAEFPTQISSNDDGYDMGYFIVQVSDTTNSRYQMSEVLVLDDYSSDLGTEDTYIIEYGNVETVSGLGTIGTRLVKPTVGVAATVQLLFTPLENIDTQVKVYMNALRQTDDDKSVIDFNNGTIESSFGSYTGTDRDIKRAFDLKHKTEPIFDRSFEGNNSDIVDVSDNTIKIPNHFFVSGERVSYIHAGAGSTQAIGITTTSFVGIGSTNLVPSDVYVIKINDDTIKLASTAENALKSIPENLDFVHVGIGTSHRFVSNNQNAKVLLTIDNVIQSPVVSTSVTTTLERRALTTDDLIYFSGITSFFGGDLVKINNEILKIEGVGIGSTNAIRVRREWLGTTLVGHSTGDVVTKVTGNYNIVNNVLNFVEAPYGNTPFGTSTNAPDERDWTGISTSSSFHGRVFLRSGNQNSSNETYYKNYVFSDISENFDGNERWFTLKDNGSNTSGISTENAIIVINDIFQGPGLSYDYVLTEQSGITSVRFTGTATSISSDPNTSNLPLGGVIVSVGSTEGFGYQPLVAAGGTAIVSTSGTIQSISIGNSGSGYRAGIQTVRVGVQTYSSTGTSIEFIGTATVTGGNIVSIAITNPGIGYTSSNPPIVVFDAPLSYSNIPLIYSSDSSSGSGSNATVDIVVGQGSSVIDFEIRNTGYSYNNNEILTVPVGGLTGIPTTSSFREFQITVQKTFVDKFSGWSVGELEVLDNIKKYFNGERVTFPLSVNDNPISIRSSKGSKIDVQDVLLIFVNDILQVPGEGYIFEGGSTITFTEPPKPEDNVKVIFYKGSGSIDVIFRDIIETIKPGDEVRLYHDIEVGQGKYLDEDARTVLSIKSTEVVETNPYFGPGNTEDENLLRPLIWCRQTEDKIINEKEIGKDRDLYEPYISPFAYIIKNVGIGSTTIYVDTLRPIFDSQNENDITLDFQNKVRFISQESKVSASATAIVSVAGTVSSIQILEGGSGYSSNPTVSIGNTIGIGTTSLATASITSGVVTSITITQPGTGYIQANPPVVLISPPTLLDEENDVTSYSGDHGIIVGFGTTTISSQTQLILDVHIPTNSYLRDPALVGVAVTISSLSKGDYFIVYNSNVGTSSTTITSLNSVNGTIGISTSFIDTVYEVSSSEIVYRPTGVNSGGVGIGTTHLRRVFVKINESFNYGSGIQTSNYFGSYSWGKIIFSSRAGVNSFTSYTQNGITGISTSMLVQRSSRLKSKNYIV